MATTMNGVCPKCGHSGVNLESKMRRKASAELAKFLDQTYFESIPVAQIAHLLEEFGFNQEGQLSGIYTGREGSAHEQVGPNTWLRLTWYQMESGRMEVLGYLS